MWEVLPWKREGPNSQWVPYVTALPKINFYLFSLRSYLTDHLLCALSPLGIRDTVMNKTGQVLVLLEGERDGIDNI